MQNCPRRSQRKPTETDKFMFVSAPPKCFSVKTEYLFHKKQSPHGGCLLIHVKMSVVFAVLPDRNDNIFFPKSGTNVIII